MNARWTGLTIDCHDPQRLAAFWSNLLGRERSDEAPGDDWVSLGSRHDPQPRLNFQKVPEPKRGKVRIHLDITVDDTDAGRALVEQLGGSWTGIDYEYRDGIVSTMLDPENNEFCIVHYR